MKRILVAIASIVMILGLVAAPSTAHANVQPQRVYVTALYDLGKVSCSPESVVAVTPVVRYSISAVDPEFRYVRLIVKVNGVVKGVYDEPVDKNIHDVYRVETRGQHVQVCAARGGSGESGPHRLRAIAAVGMM